MELPNTINIPDDTLAYTHDIVLPVSWTTEDERDLTLCYSILHYENGAYDTSYWVSPTGF